MVFPNKDSEGMNENGKGFMKILRQFSCFYVFKFMAWHSKNFFWSRMSGLQHMRMKWRRLAAGVVL